MTTDEAALSVTLNVKKGSFALEGWFICAELHGVASKKTPRMKRMAQLETLSVFLSLSKHLDSSAKKKDWRLSVEFVGKFRFSVILTANRATLFEVIFSVPQQLGSGLTASRLKFLYHAQLDTHTHTNGRAPLYK
jgi:hypothetical protein